MQQGEPLRKVAGEEDVSNEAVRHVLRATRRQRSGKDTE